MIEESKVSRPEWASLAYQDVLRPPVGMRVGWALLTTYSGELRGVAAALLAMAGSEREGGSGTAVQLAGAVQQLRGKVHIALQSGRLAPLRGTQAGLAVLLDTFLHEVVRNERRSSWHPKVALLRFDRPQEPGAQPVWRLWVGSRNLTGSENLELGAVLEQASRGGVELTSLADDMQWLAAHSGLQSKETRKVLRSLSEVRWLLPDDWKQATMRLHGAGSAALPAIPGGVQELVVVSPFLDASTLHTLSGWSKDGSRVLISNRDSFRKLFEIAPEVISRWSLYALAQPNYPEEREETLQGQPDADPRAVDQEEVLGWSLHAKLIAARCGKKGVQLWMGSANATARGWSGRNVECVLEVKAREGIWSGITELIRRAEPVTLTDFEGEADVTDDLQERLEAARKALVASWSVRLQHEQGCFHAVSAHLLEVVDAEIRVRAGVLGRPMILWPKDAFSVDLGEIPLSQQSHFLQICLELSESSVCWLMRCPTNPELPDGRDDAAIAAALSPSELLKLWMSEMKDLRSEEEGPDWDSVAGVESSTSMMGANGNSLTLEDILKCWGTRQASEFDQIVERWGGVLCHMRAQPQWSGDESATTLEALHSVSLKLTEKASQ